MDRVDDGVDGDTPYTVMTTRAPAVLINVPCKLHFCFSKRQLTDITAGKLYLLSNRRNFIVTLS